MPWMKDDTQPVRLADDLEAGHQLEQHPEGHRDLAAGQVRAEAEVRAGRAEAEVRVGVAGRGRTPSGSANTASSRLAEL